MGTQVTVGQDSLLPSPPPLPWHISEWLLLCVHRTEAFWLSLGTQGTVTAMLLRVRCSSSERWVTTAPLGLLGAPPAHDLWLAEQVGVGGQGHCWPGLQADSGEMRLMDRVSSTGWGLHCAPQLRASWHAAPYPGSTSPWPGLQHSHPAAGRWEPLRPGPGGQEPRGGGCWMGATGRGGTAQPYAPARSICPGKNPHFASFFFFLDWVEITVASDSDSFPEVCLPLGEALLL